MSSVVDKLQNIDGADARVIAHLESLDFRIDYIREDIKSRYSGEDFEEAYRLIMGNLVNGDDFEDLIGKEFEAQALFFEDIVVLVLPSARYQAIFASFDRHEALPINQLIRTASAAKS